MSIVQDAYDIPDDIATGIATGIYKRFGSVVRWASGSKKGSILTHLKPASVPNEQAQKVGSKAFQLVKEHKKGTVITLAGVVLAGAGTIALMKIKSKEPKVVVDFRRVLRKYLDSIRNGSLTGEYIDDLIEKIKAIKKDKKYDKIKIQFTADDLEKVVYHIRNFTIHFANNNQTELIIPSENDDDYFDYLMSYLKFQKGIFDGDGMKG